MDQKDVKKLAKLREFVIEYYNKLEAPTSSTSLMNTRDVAYTCETIIRSMDDLLKEHVTFE